LPFLRACLKSRCNWITAIHGQRLFQSGQLLRTAQVKVKEQLQYYLGWKGPDMGKFANIRQELDEEITPESEYSYILNSLGGKSSIKGFQEVNQELERLGHAQFMSFEGEDLTGYYKPHGISLKLMRCEQLRWPLIVEIEKTADSPEVAVRCEQALLDLCILLQLHDRVVKEEPPTLLYQALCLLKSRDDQSQATDLRKQDV
jgi:hypothetical protein